MIWTKFFDGIYLVNLPQRTERWMSAAEELHGYDIPFTTEKAMPSLSGNGHGALILTMRRLIMRSLNEGKTRILVFEDDLDFIEDPDKFMPDVIRQLDGLAWDMLSLGPNTHEPLERVSDNLLRMKKCRALHAMAYNFSGMKFIHDTSFTADDHLDVVIEEKLQPKGNCYCTYPLICTQANGPSDIGAETDKSYIEERFKQNTFHLM